MIVNTTGTGQRRNAQVIALALFLACFSNSLFALSENYWGRTTDQIFRDTFAIVAGTIIQDCSDCPQAVVLSGGTFLMGSPATEPQSTVVERPQRLVTVPSFAMGRYAVTFDEWDACVADGGCDHNPSDSGWGRGDRPVINVNWYDAQQYVTWLSTRTGRPYRLPSEAEWEFATRAGSVGRFNTGDCITTDQANFDGLSPAQGCPQGARRSQTLPVGSFAPNAFGLYDTHGNVNEWVQDCWNANYENAPTDGSAWLDGDCSRSPQRGGNWAWRGNWVRSAYRDDRPLRTARDNRSGFRIVRPLTP